MQNAETKILEDLLDHPDALDPKEELDLSQSLAEEFDFDLIVKEMEAMPRPLLQKLINRIFQSELK